MLCEEIGARLRVAPIDDDGELILEEFEKLLSPRTKIAALSHVSNALGTVNPAQEMVRMAHERGVPVLLDGAQAVPHGRVDVGALDCDFYVFSGHKLFGPSGIGALYGKPERLEAMPPFLGGGEMILSVSFEKTTYAGVPHRFEAGTPDIAGAVGLGAAIDYLESLDLDAAAHKIAVISFVLDGVHPHDIGTILDQEGIALRTGHHCAQPLMERFGVPATARASFALYNTRSDVDALVAGLHRVREVFA
jgi:cysteine desulfurase/selenocysteine lyase